VSVVSTHVLDVAAGCPAAGMRVRLERGTAVIDTAEIDTVLIDTGTTDADGRVASLGPEALPAGTYRLIFDTGGYLAQAFFPEVTITFTVADEPGQHYHVPLLLSPFGYTTYRGS
jgi:5-hydroxyisourate hydrolase